MTSFEQIRSNLEDDIIPKTGDKAETRTEIETKPTDPAQTNSLKLSRTYNIYIRTLQEKHHIPPSTKSNYNNNYKYTQNSDYSSNTQNSLNIQNFENPSNYPNFEAYTNNSNSDYYNLTQKGNFSTYYEETKTNKKKKILPREDYTNQLKLLGSFNNTSTFFSIFNHIKSPKNLPKNSALLIFLKDSEPTWEANPEGGMISMSVDRMNIDKFWEMFVFFFICDYESFELENNLIGGIVKSSHLKFECQFWLRNINSISKLTLEVKLKKLFRIEDYSDNIFYSKEFYMKK
jgi:Eukaryotic initiation factor 4E